MSKAGNSRARTVSIELAWLWLRHQPDSELSRGFRQRVGNIKGASGASPSWRSPASRAPRYLEPGSSPTGAVMRQKSF